MTERARRMIARSSALFPTFGERPVMSLHRYSQHSLKYRRTCPRCDRSEPRCASNGAAAAADGTAMAHARALPGSTGSRSHSAYWRRSHSQRLRAPVQPPHQVGRRPSPCRQRSPSGAGPRDWPMTHRTRRCTQSIRLPTPSRLLPPSRATPAIRRGVQNTSGQWHSGHTPNPKVSQSIRRRTRSTWPTPARHRLGRQRKDLQCIRSEWLRAGATNHCGPGRTRNG